MLLDNYLKKLDQSVSPAHIEAARKLQQCTLEFGEVERLPVIVNWPAPDWLTFPYGEGFDDPQKMLLNELCSVWAGALVKDDRMYTIRANHGVGIIPSIFGCKIKLVDEKQMPWVEPLDDAQLEHVISNGVPDLTGGLGGRVLDTITFFKDQLSRYENLAQGVRIYICDVQGPFDLAHLIMGHRIYTDVIDNPDIVHRVLSVVTDTFIALARMQREIIGEAEGTHYHSHHYLRGEVRLCDDSPTNLSAEMYREFCRPYNERVFNEFGGGWVHYCGQARHMLPEVLALKQLTGINFGNPEKQDSEAMFRASAAARVPVIGWPQGIPPWVQTGVTLIRSAKSLEDARAITNVS